jgi:hypothetical protein
MYWILSLPEAVESTCKKLKKKTTCLENVKNTKGLFVVAGCGWCAEKLLF